MIYTDKKYIVNCKEDHLGANQVSDRPRDKVSKLDPGFTLHYQFKLGHN